MKKQLSYNNKNSSKEVYSNGKWLNFKELDSIKIQFREDKYLAIENFNKENKTNYQYFSEMTYDLFMNKDYTPGEIGKLFNVTNVAIRNHLKYKMNCKMLSHGGFHSKSSVTGLPGVYPTKFKGRYTAWYYRGSFKIYIGTYNSLFMAVWDRRAIEIKEGFNKKSLAQEFINKNWRNISNLKEAPQPKRGRPYEGEERKHNEKFY